MNRWMKKMIVVLTFVLVAPIAISENVSAASLDDIKNEKSVIQEKSNALQAEINELLDAIDAENKKTGDLEKSIADNTADMEETKEKVADQEELVEERLEQAREQLKALQTSEVNQNVIMSLLNAESLTDFFQRMYNVMLLTDASQEQLSTAQADQKKLVELEEHLASVQKELAAQKKEADAKEKELQSNLASLKEKMAENRRQIAELDAKESAEVAAQEPTATTASSSATSSSASTANAGEWMSFETTAYSYQEPGLTARTATGINLQSNPRVIAVDPSVIPLGSVVEIQGLGTYIAGDTGGAINGRIIDIHFPTVSQCYTWGRRHVNIRIVG